MDAKSDILVLTCDLTGEICRGREFADMLTYPYNCQHYVTCLSERSPVVQSCSAGLCYDQENGICDIKLNTGLKLNTYSTSFIIFLPLLCLRTKIFDFINYSRYKEKVSTVSRLRGTVGHHYFLDIANCFVFFIFIMISCHLVFKETILFIKTFLNFLHETHIFGEYISKVKFKDSITFVTHIFITK